MAQAVRFQVSTASRRPKPTATGHRLDDALAIVAEQGLLGGGRTLTVRGRMPSLLVEKAKKKTGIQSASKLAVAQPDGHGHGVRVHGGDIRDAVPVEVTNGNAHETYIRRARQGMAGQELQPRPAMHRSRSRVHR